MREVKSQSNSKFYTYAFTTKSKSKTLYKGLENKVHVQIAGVSQKLLFASIQIDTSQCTFTENITARLKTSGLEFNIKDTEFDSPKFENTSKIFWSREYTIIPKDSSLLNVKLNVFLIDSTTNDTSLVGSDSYSVKQIPQPTLKISLLKKHIIKEELFQIKKLDSNFDMDYRGTKNWAKVRVFELKIIRKKKGIIYSNKSFGNLLTTNMVNALKTVKKDDQVIFENIKSEKFNYMDLIFIVQ